MQKKNNLSFFHEQFRQNIKQVLDYYILSGKNDIALPAVGIFVLFCFWGRKTILLMTYSQIWNTIFTER